MEAGHRFRVIADRHGESSLSQSRHPYRAITDIEPSPISSHHQYRPITDIEPSTISSRHPYQAIIHIEPSPISSHHPYRAIAHIEPSHHPYPVTVMPAVAGAPAPALGYRCSPPIRGEFEFILGSIASRVPYLSSRTRVPTQPPPSRPSGAPPGGQPSLMSRRDITHLVPAPAPRRRGQARRRPGAVRR